MASSSSSSQSKRGNEDMDDLDSIVQARNSRKHRSQKFHLAWCKDDELRDWLLPVKNDVYKARCKYCNVQFVAELSNIRGHGNGKKHKNILASLTSGTKTQNLISKFITKDISSDLKLQVSRAEIKIASFVVEHNISFLATDHLTEMLKECFPDSNIAKNLAMKRTKSTAIIKNVIGLPHKELLAVTLRKTKFSVLTDESTDIGTVKTACVVIRYFDEKSGHVESVFWDLHKIYDSSNPGNATAEHLYNGLMNSLMSFDIPKSNIIGFGSDGCNVMMGENNSVSSRFKTNCPGKELQNKWRNLRTCFRREVSKQKHGKFGQAATKRRKYVFFDQLLFFLPTMEDRPTVSDCNPSDINEYQSGSEDDSEVVKETNISVVKETNISVVKETNISVDDSPVNTLQAQKSESHGKSVAKKNMSYEESLLKILKDKKEEVIDEDKSFLLSLVPAFKKLTDTQKMDAKMEFLSTLKRITLSRPEASHNGPIGYGTSSNYGFHGLTGNQFSHQNQRHFQNFNTGNYSSGSSTPNTVPSCSGYKSTTPLQFDFEDMHTL